MNLKVAVAALSLALAPFVSAPAQAAIVAPRANGRDAQVRERVLYSFQGSGDGWVPQGGVTIGEDGALYGTTYNGGSGCTFGCGTAFRLARGASGYVKTIIHVFNGSDGANPNASLVLGKNGALLGVTQSGGAAGAGVVFELVPSGSTFTETVLHSFTGSDGQWPSPLTTDASGTMYGTTYIGGPRGHGTAFTLIPNGSSYAFSSIWSFVHKKRGMNPAGPVLPLNGALYGATSRGGLNGAGALFTLMPSHEGYSETILHQFGGSSGGAAMNPLIPDDSGNFFGLAGGAFSELVKVPSGYQSVTLHSFNGGDDGSWPNALMQDADGVFYGTAMFGGTSQWCLGNTGCGIVFAFTRSSSGYTESILHRFQADGMDGNAPIGGLTMDKHGTLYGTTQSGGTGVYTWCGNAMQGCGTVFSVTT